MSANRVGGDSLSPRALSELTRLDSDDALGQLWRRDGEMARLGSEGGALKLDWVAAVPWLLAHPEALAEVEDEARALLARGVRHVIWAGMGGSVLTMRVLRGLGYGDAAPLTLHPLDSTDPAALNAIVRELAAAKGVSLPADVDLLGQRELLRALLEDVALVAVAMGMTSEEPITHLAWFATALDAADLPLADHLRAMSLPDSYLDAWAIERGIPRLALQLDGGSGTGGRMSAPGTRVFLLPAALWLAAQELTLRSASLGQGQASDGGALADILRQAWQAYGFDLARTNPAANSYVRLAAELSAASVRGAVRLAISAPDAWGLVRDWAEQLFEESLGKGGKGVMIFAEERMPSAPAHRPERDGSMGASGEVWLRIVGDASAPTEPGGFTLREPLLASANPRERLAGLASLFLGLQLTMALYGYLQDITFAGQPAVEDYKTRARALRDGDGEPLPTPSATNSIAERPLTLFASAEIIAATPHRTPRAALVDALRRLRAMEPLPYLDLTINGEAPPDTLAALDSSLRALAVERLSVPYKLRRAPAAYHSTEQSEMDGPPALISLRALALRHETSMMGAYSPRFLEAQAVATWQAMTGVGRACMLLLYDGDTADTARTLATLLDAAARDLADG
ncbi:MAG TPA: hypothetical protein VE338_01940 [Ktedonobacterales bacterium]|nr:hypothetical protein [Ktedonobacterales bacterium]